MDSLSVTTILQKERCVFFWCYWENVGPAGVDSDIFTNYVQSNSAALCSSGNYRGYSRQYLIWPTGEAESGYGYGIPVSLSC